VNIDGAAWRTIWPLPDGSGVGIIDQTRLPHEFATLELRTLDAAAHAIRVMQVRGAPLIGATAAYGMALAMRVRPDALDEAARTLLAARPTAVNLRWAVERMQARLAPLPPAARFNAAWREAAAICDQDVAANRAIGQHGLALLRRVGRRAPLNLMTHCNAGWLATVDWGTALAPIYAAAEAGLAVHVWVSETRPRNQGASLTAWELGQHGIPHTLVADNACGHLMRTGRVDAVIVGADRIAAHGDTANKIGTYLKALAARDNGMPFYVAAPLSSFDARLADGAGIPIEERDAREVTHLSGRDAHGEVREIALAPEGCAAANPAFDVTPARLVDAFITERGVVAPAALPALLAEFAQGGTHGEAHG
jgi:methylthioribose-1-phosphate isomerase